MFSDNLSRMVTRNMSPVCYFKVAVRMRQTSYAGKKEKRKYCHKCHKLAQVYLKLERRVLVHNE